MFCSFDVCVSVTETSWAPRHDGLTILGVSPAGSIVCCWEALCVEFVSEGTEE